MKKKRFAFRKQQLLLTGFLMIFSCAAIRCTHSHSGVTPEFVREGANIVIPPGSTLRSHIVLDTVRTEEVSFQVIAPATVEADPKYYARILPPMTGGIVAVHVQLGDAVRK